MMTNVIVKTRLNQNIIKNSNLIQAMKNNVCPKATVIRRPNFSENRIWQPHLHFYLVVEIDKKFQISSIFII